MKKHRGFKLFILSLGLIALGLFFLFATDFSLGRSPDWGVTFSRSYALDLQLNWQETYLAILDDLKVSHLRLSAYWDEVEPQKDQYQFADLDWQIDQAASRQVEIILAVGRRWPRWPECHDPGWVKHYPPADANQEILDLLTVLVKRYQTNPQITAWQIENEPLFSWFGFCPPPDIEFLKKEIDLVRSLDPSRPVVVTDSGELSNWQAAAGLTDVLGTTLYRVVWNKRIGFFSYWFVPPAFYHYKASLTKYFQPNLKRVIVTELQMEPWTMDKHMLELTLEEQKKSFDLKRFKNNIRYAQKTGLPQVYLWGAEYWYWLKLAGQPEIWQTAQKLWLKD